MSLRKKIGRNKYRNKPQVLDGIYFPSTKQARRWTELQLLQSAGEISNLKREVTFPLVVNGQLICKYRADAVYEEKGKRIVEDTKGFRTDVYRIKKALMKATLGIEVMET